MGFLFIQKWEYPKLINIREYQKLDSAFIPIKNVQIHKTWSDKMVQINKQVTT